MSRSEIEAVEKELSVVQDTVQTLYANAKTTGELYAYAEVIRRLTERREDLFARLEALRRQDERVARVHAEAVEAES